MSVTSLHLFADGTLGTNEGANSDGCLVGLLAPSALSKGLLESYSQEVLCITDDGGLYVNETTEANEGTADDVEIVGTTLAADDAIFIGRASTTFSQINIEISTQGDYTDPVWAWEYWDGSSWTVLSDLVDGTTAWEAAAGNVSVTFTKPVDWVKNTVDNVLAYWVRARCASVTATVTPCQLEQLWIVVPAGEGVFSDDTTDINSAGAADVALLSPTQPSLNDAFYYGHASKFCKIQLITSTAITGTQTLVWEYWDGSAWVAIPAPIEDKSAGYSATAGTHMISFEPPADWAANTVANGPNSNAGYFVRCRMSAVTSVTADPVASRAYVYPLVTGAVGVPTTWSGTVTGVTMNAATVSATNNDSRFLLVNTATGAFAEFTWTGGVQTLTAVVSLAVTVGQELVIVQIQEDGTTELVGGSFYLS